MHRLIPLHWLSHSIEWLWSDNASYHGQRLRLSANASKVLLSLLLPLSMTANYSFPGRAYSVTNTCSVDAALFPLYALFRTESNVRDIVLNSAQEPFLSLRDTFSLVDARGWDEAGLHWLTVHKRLPSQKSNNYNIYGAVDANVLNFIKNPIQLHRTKKNCARRNCSGFERLLTHSDIALE